MIFKDAYRQLNSAQKEAVDTIDGPLLIIAGPGTGKTQLLALRAANILQKTDVAPQNILCLTYTEVGARNMRERLSQFIGKEAYDVRISTYHSFGSEITRGYGEYFNEYNADQPIDNIGQDVIMREIYQDLSVNNILWRSDVYLKDALAFISECKRSGLQPDDLLKIAKSNQVFITKASKISSKALQSLGTMNKRYIGLFDSLYLELNKIVINQKLPRSLTMLDALATTELANAIVKVNETGKTNALTVWKNQWLIKNSKDQWVFSGLKEVNKIIAGAEIYQLYLNKLKDKKLFDYDDMILRAIKGIKEHNDLRFTLQEQYQYIMLDEFQDTNLSQLELIELLTNNPVNMGRPNVMAVGDDDQAIFSFQGADLTNMIRFYNLYKNVKTITLTENWRSHTDILEIGKTISDQIEDRLHAKLGIAQKLLIAKNPNLPKQSHIARHEFKSDVAQFAWVADQVQKEIKKGIKPSEIAVIAPRHKNLEPLVPFLNRNNIPLRYDKRENVFADPRIEDLINQTKLVLALANNNQQLANSLWPSVLSAELWQLATSDIWQISWESNSNYYKDQETSWQALMLNNEKLKTISLFFTKLSFVAKSETLESMLDYLTGVTALAINEPDLKNYTSPYYEYYFNKEAQSSSPEQFTLLLSNLTVLRQHLRDYKRDQEESLKITDLIEFYEAYQGANEKLLNTSPYHSSTDAVQLLTAYGAKGLEFEIVFVLATLDDVWGMGARGQSSNITLPLNLQIIRQAGSSKDERKRLFYVALTRAKHTLIMASYSQNYAGKNTKRLEFLDEIEEDDNIVSRSLPDGKNIVYKNDNAAPDVFTLDTNWQNRHIAGFKQNSLKEYIKPRLETFLLSATHLNSFTDLVYGGPEQFFINTILKFPKAPSADGQYGSAIHETLDAIQKIVKASGNIPELDDILNIFKQKLKAKRLSETDFIKQHQRGINELSVFIPWWWPNFDKSNESEKSFKDEGAFVGDAHLTGTLDNLKIDYENLVIEVVDFKTGRPYDKWEKDVKLHKYRQQLLFYKLLIENSHTYNKFTVEQGRLVFIQPNEENNIDELLLDFKSNELDRTNKLIQAVWQRIMHLDFPDTSQYSKDLKGIIAFEDWLINN